MYISDPQIYVYKNLRAFVKLSISASLSDMYDSLSVAILASMIYFEDSGPKSAALVKQGSLHGGTTALHLAQ